MTGAGSETIDNATPFQYGSSSAPTSSAAMTNVQDDIDFFRGVKAAWWMLEIPADHDPSVRVRFDLLQSTLSDQGDTDTLIAVFKPADHPNATGPRDLNYIQDVSGRLDDNPNRSGADYLLTDGDVSNLNPGTYFVRCSVYGYSQDTDYVLRIGDLTFGKDVVYPPVVPSVVTARTQGGLNGPQYGITSAAPKNYGKGVVNETCVGLAGFVGPGRSTAGQWYLYITDITNDKRLEQVEPLPDDIPLQVVSGVIGGGLPDGGPQESAPDGVNNVYYPNGHFENSGGGGGAYTFSRQDWAHGVTGAFGALNATSYHALYLTGPGSMVPFKEPYNQYGYMDPEGKLNEFWYPGNNGYDLDRPAGANLIYDTPGHVVSSRIIVATQLKEGSYYEPSDQIVIGIRRSPGDTSDPDAYSWNQSLSGMTGLAVHPIPWLGAGGMVPTDPQQVTYSAFDVPEGWSMSRQAEILAFVNASISGTVPPEDGWKGVFGPDSPNQIAGTWGWRFAGTQKSWPDDSVDSRSIDVNVWAGFEYQYQPPSFHYVVPGARETVMLDAPPSLTPALIAELKDTGQRFD